MATTSRRPIPKDCTVTAVTLADTGTLVAAATGHRLFIWEIVLTNSNPSIAVTFRDATTALTGAELWASYSASRLEAGRPIDDEIHPLFETTADAAFTALCGAATGLTGHIKWTSGPA